MKENCCRVAIVGAGLCGLATAIAIRRGGHDVNIFEKAPHWSEVGRPLIEAASCMVRLTRGQFGAGLTLSPNATKLFDAWGLLPDLRGISNRINSVESFSHRGKLLSIAPLGNDAEKQWGAPFLVTHRLKLQRMLADIADRSGVITRLGVHVIGVEDAENGSHLQLLRTSNDELFEADVVLIADGERSSCRRLVTDQPHALFDSSSHVYRVSVPVDALRPLPMLRNIVEERTITNWLGPGGNAACYRIEDQDGVEVLNLILTSMHEPDSDTQSMMLPTKVNRSSLLARFRDWDPRILQIIEAGQGGTRWCLLESTPLEKWYEASVGIRALIGDAAHAVLPFLGQGACLAFEDAAILGFLFTQLQHKSQLGDLLTIFESLRKPRVAYIRKASKNYARILYMSDGIQQEERDRQLQQEETFAGFPDFFRDPEFHERVWDYDAIFDVRSAWDFYIKGTYDGLKEHTHIAVE